jgi:hypothetical protein
MSATFVMSQKRRSGLKRQGRNRHRFRLYCFFYLEEFVREKKEQVGFFFLFGQRPELEQKD